MTRHPNYDPRTARNTPPVAAEPDRACNGVDPKVFFPIHTARLRDAIAICRTCPHRRPCLDWAIETGQRHGVWGGTGPDERAAMIRREAS